MRTAVKKHGRLMALSGSVLLVVGIWHAGEAASARVAKLPVLPAPQAKVPQTSLTTSKNFYPLWAKRAPVNVEGGDIDGAFIAPPLPVAPSTPPAPQIDVVALVKAAVPLSVTGASDSGIFIGGEFVQVGQKVQMLGRFADPAHVVVPVLIGASPGEVRLKVGAETISVRVGGGS